MENTNNEANGIPSLDEMKKIMRSLAEVLYETWKQEIGARLRNLEFDGYITKEHIDVPEAVWRLPNDEVRYALCKLEEDIYSLGYDYEFKFDDVDDVYWIMFYSITMPERDDALEEEENDPNVKNRQSDLMESTQDDEDFAY